NIFILAAWLGFQVLSQFKMTARSCKKLAQAMLLSAILAVPLSAMLPGDLFPQQPTTVRVAGFGDSDNTLVSQPTVKRALKITAGAVKALPDKAEATPLPFVALLVLGALAMLAYRARSWWRMASLLKNSLSLHEIGRTSLVVSDAVDVPFSVMF